MRYARYLRLERYIAASDTGGIIERWKYGRRLLEDDTATTPAGNLKHGVLAKLIGNAAAQGFKLSEREVQYRLQAGRAYRTEVEIRTAGADFRDWTELRTAGFPAVEAPADAELFDPRDADERARDTARELARRSQVGREAQLALFDYFPDDRFDETSTLAELMKYGAEMAELTQRYVQRDRERAAYLQRLIDAVGGDLSKTWAEADAVMELAA